MMADSATSKPARGASSAEAVAAPRNEAPRDEASGTQSFTSIEIAVVVVAVVAAIAAMRIAQPFLVPVVLGILMSYTLRPLVSMLERFRIPRMAAAAIVITVLVSIAGATAYVLRDDVNNAIAELPGAAHKLRQVAVDEARRSPGPITHVKAVAAELNKIEAETLGKAAPPEKPPSSGVAVQFENFVTEQSGKALSVMVEIFVALLLAFFLLAAGNQFRRKVAHIAGESLARRRLTVEVLNEIDDQIQGYMMTLLIANVLIGAATWGALALLRVPNAGLWGAITGLLHIVPYAGTVVAAGAIGVASFVHSGTMGEAFLAMGMVTAIAAAIGMGLATYMQGRATRMNAVAVFIGVLFFGWLWGGWGLLLGTPLVAVLKSISDRVEALHPISEMLSS